MKSLVRLKLFCINVHNDTTRLLKFYLMVAMAGLLCVFVVKVHRNPDLIRSVDTLSFDQQLEDDAQIWQMDLEEIMNDMGLKATTRPSDELLDTGDNMITFTFAPQFSTIYQDESDGPYIMTTQSAENMPFGLENEEFENAQPPVTANLDDFVHVGGGLGGGTENEVETEGDDGVLSKILGEYEAVVTEKAEGEEEERAYTDGGFDEYQNQDWEDVQGGDDDKLVTALEQTQEGLPDWLSGGNQEGTVEQPGEEVPEEGAMTDNAENMEELVPPWVIGGSRPQQPTPHAGLQLPSFLHHDENVQEGGEGMGEEQVDTMEGVPEAAEETETDEFGVPNTVVGDDDQQGWLTTPGMDEMFTADEMRLTSAFIPTLSPDEEFGGAPMGGDPVSVNMYQVKTDGGEVVDLDLDINRPSSDISVAQPGIKPQDIILPFQDNNGMDEGTEEIWETGETGDRTLPFNADVGNTGDALSLQPFGHIPDAPKLPDAPFGMAPPGAVPASPALAHITAPPPLNLPNSFVMKDGKLLPADTSPKYLFPMFRLGVGGPNYQFNSLKTAIGYAIKNGRTLVLTHFFPHHMTQISEKIPFNETFDIKKLSEILPVASIDKYKKDCDNNVGVAVHGPPKLKGKSSTDYNKVYETVRLRLGVIFGVKFPGMSFVPKTESETHTKMAAADKVKCLGMYWPHNVAALTPPVVGDDKMKMIDNNLLRSANIQAMGKLYVELLFKDCPFLGIHWSLNEDLKKIWCETVYAKERRPLCYSNPLPSRNISSILIKVLEKHQLGCAYAAFAPSTILAHMRDLSLNMKGIKTFANLYELDTPYTAMIRADENLLSLVEQEICARAQLFIGVSNSWWTYHVARERTASSKPTFYIHDFVLPSGNKTGVSQPIQPGGPQGILSKPQVPVKPPSKPPAKPPTKPSAGKPGQYQGKPAGGSAWKPPAASNQWKPPGGGSNQWKPGGAPSQGQWKPPGGAPNQGGQWRPPAGGQWKPGGGAPNQGGQWKPPGGAPNQGGQWKPPGGGAPNQGGQWKPPGGGAPNQGQWKPPGGAPNQGAWKPPGSAQNQGWKPPTGGQWKPGGGAPQGGGQWKPPQSNQWRPPGQPRSFVGAGNWPKRW